MQPMFIFSPVGPLKLRLRLQGTAVVNPKSVTRACSVPESLVIRRVVLMRSLIASAGRSRRRPCQSKREWPAPNASCGAGPLRGLGRRGTTGSLLRRVRVPVPGRHGGCCRDSDSTARRERFLVRDPNGEFGIESCPLFVPEVFDTDLQGPANAV